jgi:hypothetical protein
MLIPRGKPVHENLATTFVLVDALVTDLCEGGFSGVIEIVLRDTDAHVLIAEGKVVGVLEQRGVSGRTGELQRRGYSRATVAELAARARYERGRISIYSCSPETSAAIAGLSGAEQLYAALSTDFADLDKMISKLSRERERQWFIELATGDGGTALIHLKDEQCRIISTHPQRGEHESATAALTNNPSLVVVLETARQTGGTFDVYFRGAEEELPPVEIQAPAEPAVAPRSEAPATAAAADARTGDVGARPTAVVADEIPGEVAAAPPDLMAEPSTAEDPIPLSPDELAEARLETLRRPAAIDAIDAGAGQNIWQPVMTEEPLPEDFEEEPALATEPETPPEAARPMAPAFSVGQQTRQTTGLSAIRNELQATVDFTEVNEAQIMNEVKRLLGEIARTIEDAARSVEQRDTFSIYLRAGQLKVADRYPFLDPFGAEFEYLAGEIAFVGSAAPWEFIEGLTEALKLAVEGVAQASVHGQKIRSQISEDLRRLLDRNRAEFIEYGLDGAIEQIIAA